ncbi:thioredoxin family protein [bacterium]|nr:thioredoxin family protein [bacterium]
MLTDAKILTGRDRVKRAMRCEGVDRAPWVPFVGSHGGSLLGVTAEEYLKSEDLIVRGVQAAIERYQPDGIPVVFDLQVEAETFGCDLKWATDNPPSVVSHPLSSGGGATLADLRIPGPEDGRIGISLNAMRRLREADPDVALYGLITGPFTLTLHLMGTEIFMKMFEDPEAIKEVMDFSRRVGEAMAGYYIDAGCDVVGVVDPMTSQISPDQFREYVTPYAAPVFESIRRRGALGSFFVCGHAQQNVKAMCECGPDNVSVDENIALEYVRDICIEQGISYGGNMRLTTVLLLGTPLDAQRNAIECLDIAGNKGFILAPGCDLPYATPPENLEAVALVVRDPYQRDVVKAMEIVQGDEDRLDMHEYGQTDRVIVDIITLDSEGCAPCQYMVEAVRQIAPEFEGIVQWREHKIKQKESLRFMTSLMVKNIPTICIDGRITFVSRIPAREELIAAIRHRIYEKLRMKIRRKKASLTILGREDDPRAHQARENIERAVTELGAQVHINFVSNPRDIQTHGILMAQTPAVILTTHQLKSTAGVPDVSVVKEWVKGVIV